MSQELLHQIRDFILGNYINHLLGSMGLLLMLFYVGWALCAKRLNYTPQQIRRMRLVARAINWGVFGIIFFLFEPIVSAAGLLTWRATARIALFFLMLSELAYQIGAFGALWREMRKWKLIQSFQSLLP